MGLIVFLWYQFASLFHNIDVTSLVNSLSGQTILSNQIYEIVAIDDCSEERVRAINRKVCKKHIYVELPGNVGRSKIRNLFLNYAKYRYLLFLDCDSLIGSPGFLSRYFEKIKQESAVVCGEGSIKESGRRENELPQVKYGIARESKSHLSFTASNFLIDREILTQIKFDERIADYGHETLCWIFAEKGQYPGYPYR